MLLCFWWFRSRWVLAHSCPWLRVSRSTSSSPLGRVRWAREAIPRILDGWAILDGCGTNSCPFLGCERGVCWLLCCLGHGLRLVGVSLGPSGVVVSSSWLFRKPSMAALSIVDQLTSGCFLIWLWVLSGIRMVRFRSFSCLCIVCALPYSGRKLY